MNESWPSKSSGLGSLSLSLEKSTLFFLPLLVSLAPPLSLALSRLALSRFSLSFNQFAPPRSRYSHSFQFLPATGPEAHRGHERRLLVKNEGKGEARGDLCGGVTRF